MFFPFRALSYWVVITFLHTLFIFRPWFLSANIYTLLRAFGISPLILREAVFDGPLGGQWKGGEMIIRNPRGVRVFNGLVAFPPTVVKVTLRSFHLRSLFYAQMLGDVLFFPHSGSDRPSPCQLFATHSPQSLPPLPLWAVNVPI